MTERPHSIDGARSRLEIDRRRALTLLAGSMAFALSSCGPPPEEIVPFVTMPEGLTPGLPLQFATAVALSGYAQGVLATSYEGRPTRLDGNPRHPASLGAIDIFAQAQITSLYSPDRAQAVRHGDDIDAWSAFEGALQAQLEQEKSRRGRGIPAAMTSDVIASLTRSVHAVAQWHHSRPGGRMTPLEKINSLKMPFAELKGVTFTEASQDRVVARMPVRAHLCTLGHILHGGAVMALADSVGAAATVINLPEDAKGTTTIESKTNFIGPAREGTTVIATATPVHRGRRTQVWQTRLETEEGKLVAIVTQTQMVLM